MLLFAVPVLAEDEIYVLSNGRHVSLARSKTELGVVFDEIAEIEACSRNLMADGCGTLETAKGAELSRVRIFKGTDISKPRRARLRSEPGVQEVRAVYRAVGSETPLVSSGEIVLKLRDRLDELELQQLWTDYQVVLVGKADGLRQVFRVAPSDPEHSEVLRARVMAGDPRIRWAQPNFRRPTQTRQVGPRDEFFSSQWHLNNTGQVGGQIDADIDAPEAWLLAEGQGILIGMFDDSCDVDHEDLAEAYTGNGHDPTVESNSPGFEDPRPKQINDRHGTSVMGFAVARANTVGGRGVAYLSQFTASRGSSSFLTDFDRASAFTFARQQDVDVHINSWGIFGPNSAVLEEALRVAYEDGRPRPAQMDDSQPDVPGTTPSGMEEEQNTRGRGMVIVWASGNEGILLEPGFDYSMVPHVIGVGATNASDILTAYSNFGSNINVVAPGGEDETQGLVSTDNEDGIGKVDEGYNVAGSEFDTRGLYTNSFIGTSAACPIVAGVAALILSMNPDLTADDVRVVLEHSADRVSESDAQYHPITGRSARYGFGRVNARRAVEAAQQSLNNGGFTWPERPFNIRISGGRLRWQTSNGTNEFLIVQSSSPFEFRAIDSQCYDIRQQGCSSAPLVSLPTGVTVVLSGEGDNADVPDCDGLVCEFGLDQNIILDSGNTGGFFGIFGRNAIGRYSFGVAVDSSGAVTDPGPELGLTDSIDTGTGGDPTVEGPKVTISVSPLEGVSPLTVRFVGNAVTTQPIDESETEWDFDIDSEQETKANTRNAVFTYQVPAGQTRTFSARLTMADVLGNFGTATAMIRVQGAGGESTEDVSADSSFRIVVGIPGNPDADIDSGRAPLSVELSINATSLMGTFQSVSWDLGDGNRARSLIVPHVYNNDTGADLFLPITATVTTLTSAGVTVTTAATKLLTVLPGPPPQPPPTDPNFGPDAIGSGGASSCGALGFLPILFCLLGLVSFRLAGFRRRA
ncbi:MAG: S8 family serine peptidase [Planctomycetota bacterium]